MCALTPLHSATESLYVLAERARPRQARRPRRRTFPVYAHSPAYEASAVGALWPRNFVPSVLKPGVDNDVPWPPRPTRTVSPPRSHPALAHHRRDALWILAAAGVVESDHPAAPHLAVRRRRPRHARDRRPMEDRMAEHPPPRRGVRDHRRRPRGEVVLRPGLDGPRDARLVRSVARRELGVGRLADDLPRGRQHRDPDLSHGMDLAPHSQPTADLPTRLHHRDWVARGRDGLHQPPPDSVPSFRLAPLRGRRRGCVPRVGGEEARWSALGPHAFDTTSPIAPCVCGRG